MLKSLSSWICARLDRRAGRLAKKSQIAPPPSGIERRQQERFEVRLPLELEFLNPESGLPTGPQVVHSCDISAGGVCIVMPPCPVSAGARLTLKGDPELGAEAEVRWVMVLPGHARMKVGVAFVTKSGSWPI